MSDRAGSERFYATVLAVLGLERELGATGVSSWGTRWFVRSVAVGEAPTSRLHVGFSAASREQVVEFWQTGLEAGYRDDGAPGLREQYKAGYFGAFLLDPDGNSVEAVHHAGVAEAPIDHLWLRVADVPATRRHYTALAPSHRFEIRDHGPEHVQLLGPGPRPVKCSFVAGEPTVGAELRFTPRAN